MGADAIPRGGETTYNRVKKVKFIRKVMRVGKIAYYARILQVEGGFMLQQGTEEMEIEEDAGEEGALGEGEGDDDDKKDGIQAPADTGALFGDEEEGEEAEAEPAAPKKKKGGSGSSKAAKATATAAEAAPAGASGRQKRQKAK